MSIFQECFDIEKIFGGGCFTVSKIEIEEEVLLPDNSKEIFFENENEEIACKMCECNLRVNTTLTGICPGCMKKIFSAINVLSLAVPLIILGIT